MSTITKDLGDVEVRMSHGHLHGLPVVHEVHRTPVKLVRSLWYVEGMALLRMSHEQRRLARMCQSADGRQFEERVRELAEHMKAPKQRAPRLRNERAQVQAHPTRP